MYEEGGGSSTGFDLGAFVAYVEVRLPPQTEEDTVNSSTWRKLVVYNYLLQLVARKWVCNR